MDEATRNELLLLRDLGYTHLELAVGRWRLAEDEMTTANGQPPTANLLADLEKIALACEKCRLAKSRTQVVYGVGSPTADLMFIGEAPGRDEDIQGKPFASSPVYWHWRTRGGW